MVKYQELWNEENTNIRERYDLAIERIMDCLLYTSDAADE